MNTHAVESNENTAIAVRVPVGPGVGEFDDPTWKRSESILIAKYWSGAEAPVERHATAQVLWSAEALHVLFDGQQKEPLPVYTPRDLSKKTINLWDRDVCEIFISPHAETPLSYFEFEGAPNGEWLDVGIRFNEQGRQSDWEFQSGLAVAAKAEPLRIRVSMRIPWTDQIPKPQAGDKWRVNFFRCIGSGKDRGYLAWQPTFTEEPNFHIPEAFGWLRFEGTASAESKN
jgi:alpha-galactosidase